MTSRSVPAHMPLSRLNRRRVYLLAVTGFALLLASKGAPALLLLIIGVAAWRYVRGQRRKAWLRKTADRRAFAAVVAVILGWKGDHDHGWVVESWPEPGYEQATGVWLRLRFSPGWPCTPAQRVKVAEMVSDRLGGTWATSVDWTHQRLTLTRQAPPAADPVLPDRLNWVFDPAQPIDRVPIGCRADGSVVVADLTSESPHVLISATTGWGKSSLLSVLVAHVASKGGLVDVCDPKRIGFSHFLGLGSIRVHTDIGSMVGAVEQFKREMDSRYRQMEQGRDVSALPLRLAVIDELGSFRAQVAQQWKGKGQPPTFALIQQILWQGRAARMHMVVACQQASARVLGDTDCRDQFALRVAAGPQSIASSTMLFGGEPMPEITMRKGRAVCGIAAELVPVQLAYLDPARARQIAAAGLARFPADEETGLSVPVPVPTSQPPAPVPQPTSQPTVQPTSDPDMRAVQPTEPTNQQPTAEPAAPIAAGSRGAREPFDMLCRACHATWSSRASAGAVIKCQQCGKRQRVPVGARS
jgi:hypothetical protein